MSFKSKILAAAAALSLAGGLGIASATAATAATPSCGSGCVNVFSHEFGGYNHPNFVMDVFRQGAKVNQPLILWRTSNTDPAEDFTLSFQGSVSDFYAVGLVSPMVALHYGCTPKTTIAGPGGPIACSATSVDEPAFELEYSPYGVDSGLCVGLAATARAKEGVTLQPCGVSSKTVWIWDTYDQCAPWNIGQCTYDGFTFPAINGSTTNFSHPHVLTYPNAGYPTDKPRPQLFVSNLTGFSNGLGPIVGQVGDNQLWGGTVGVLK